MASLNDRRRRKRGSAHLVDAEQFVTADTSEYRRPESRSGRRALATSGNVMVEVPAEQYLRFSEAQPTNEPPKAGILDGQSIDEFMTNLDAVPRGVITDPAALREPSDHEAATVPGEVGEPIDAFIADTVKQSPHFWRSTRPAVAATGSASVTAPPSSARRRASAPFSRSAQRRERARRPRWIPWAAVLVAVVVAVATAVVLTDGGGGTIRTVSGSSPAGQFVKLRVLSNAIARPVNALARAGEQAARREIAGRRQRAARREAAAERAASRRAARARARKRRADERFAASHHEAAASQALQSEITTSETPPAETVAPATTAAPVTAAASATTETSTTPTAGAGSTPSSPSGSTHKAFGVGGLLGAGHAG